MQKTFSPIIATVLLAVQTSARELQSSTYTDPDCCKFYSDYDFQGEVTEYCTHPGDDAQTYDDVNVRSFRCGSRAQFRICQEFQDGYNVFRYQHWGECQGYEVSSAAGINEGNFLDARFKIFGTTYDVDRTQTLTVEPYNPQNQGIVTFFRGEDCSYLPASIPTQVGGGAITYNKFDMRNLGVIADHPATTWSFKIPKGHKVKICSENDDGSINCTTKTASSWLGQYGEEIMDCQQQPNAQSVHSVRVEKAKPAIGRWILISSFTGNELTQTITRGWSSELTQESLRAEETSLELAVSAGFEFQGFGASASVTGTYTQQLETSTMQQVNKEKNEEFAVKCTPSNGDHGAMGLWQWEVFSPESWQRFRTEHYICGRDQYATTEPACPHMGCKANDTALCEVCKDDLFA